jgi:hypothetical protein
VTGFQERRMSFGQKIFFMLLTITNIPMKGNTNDDGVVVKVSASQHRVCEFVFYVSSCDKHKWLDPGSGLKVFQKDFTLLSCE